MANFAITTPQVVDSLNYVLSGPSSIGNDFRGVSTEAIQSIRANPYPGPMDQWSKTDLILPLTITDPAQKINVSFQIALSASWQTTDPGVPWPLVFRVAVVRWRNIPSDNQTQNNAIEIVSRAWTTDVTADEYPYPVPIFDGVPATVPSYIDEPGEIGNYTYQVIVEWQIPLSGNPVEVDDIVAADRGFSLSLVKR